ncbi:MAG: spore coat protein [Oscillospiraceae bacterium]|nr:spore coat protein [Oscillospiraceae bacterium]
MNEQNIMQDLLNLEKGACDLYLHGTIESSTPEMQQHFKTALNESLGMQGTIYAEMAARGWYKPDCAEQQKMQQVRQKFQAA